MTNDFVTVDRSTFDTGKAKDFYGALFDWQFDQDADGYIQAHTNNHPVAGVYLMPEFFQKIRMPSFWMTYISVADIDLVVSRAESMGAKIELQETNRKGSIALIRDPSGAGFTCFQGESDSTRGKFSQQGAWVWSELMVSDISLVKDFYERVFDWKIESESEDRFTINSQSRDNIGAIQVAPDEIKGSKQYWAVYFAVNDIDATLTKVEGAGGQSEGTYEHALGRQAFALDSQGAAFTLLQKGSSSLEQVSTPNHDNDSQTKWRSIIGLISIYFIVFFEQDWAWGLLFLFWVVPDLKSGTTHFIESISRKTNPILYWSIITTWLVLSLVLLTTN